MKRTGGLGPRGREAMRRLPPVRRPVQDISGRIEAAKFGLSQAEAGDVHFTYEPTATTWPDNGWDHRRTTAAGYNRKTGRLRIEFFTNGSVYDYGTSVPVPPAIARAFRRTSSPGQFINSTLEGYGYERVV